MTNDTMKACPFCNGVAKNNSHSSCDCCGKSYTGIIECTQCGANVSHFDNDEQAIAAWNTRASAVGPDVEVIKGDALMAAATDTSFITCLDSIEWTIDYLSQRGLLARQVEEIAGLEEAIHAADSTGVFGITGWAHIIMDAARGYLAMMKVNDE